MKVISTEYFDVIFPEQSRASAELIASFADRHYEEISELLEIHLERRIPVTISPFTDKFNGYMNSFPYSHIVLYDVPPDVEFVTYRNSLESLFIHELVHVISLGTRSSILKKLHRLFGGWVMPAALTAPLYMVEGVTVSFESLDGFGRANDPLVHHRLSQALHEGTFLSPVQTTGAYDHPPFARAYYEYGGLFSAWLQNKYGMKQYALLWRETGTLPHVSLRFKKSGIYAAFKRVYGISLDEAWQDFAASFAIDTIIENPEGLLTSSPLMILSTAAGKNRVFVLDRYSRSIFSLDPETGERVRVADVGPESETIALSSDETRLLVSGYRKNGMLASAIVYELSVSTGRKTGRTWKGVKNAAYFRDGIIALSHEGHAGSIVYCNDEGETDVLLSGSPEFLFSQPVPLDANRLSLVVSVRGVRKLCVFDIQTGTLSAFSAGDEHDSRIWTYARGLSAGVNELLFSFHDGEGLYKLARMDLSQPEYPNLVLTDLNVSGGIFSPLRAGDLVVYQSRFSGTDALAIFPGDVDELHHQRFPVVLVPLQTPVIEPVSTTGFNEKRYSPVSYIRPFDFWFPFPLLRVSTKTLRVDGGGIASYMATPTDMNVFLLFAAYNAREHMADIDATWVSFVPGAPLAIRITDGIEFLEKSTFLYPYRETRAAASLSLTRGSNHDRVQYSVIPSFDALWFALPRDGASSAYEWTYEDGRYIPGLTLGIFNQDRLPWELFGRGLSLFVTGRTALPGTILRYDAVFRASAGQSLPLRITAYGVYDESGLDLDGSSVIFGDGTWISSAMVEYGGDSSRVHQWLSGTEVEVRFFSVDIQQNLSAVYCNRLFGILGWRGALYDASGFHGDADSPGYRLDGDTGFVHSLVLKAGAIVTLLPVPMLPIRMAPHGWVAWKLANEDPLNIPDNVAFGLSFQIEW